MKYTGPLPNLNDQWYENFKEFLMNPNEVKLVDKFVATGRPQKRQKTFLDPEAVP